MTGSTYLEVRIHLALPPGADPEAAFDGLADAFHALADATARDLGFDTAAHDVTMTFTFDEPIAPDEAVRRAMDLGQAALRDAALDPSGEAWDLATWTVVPSASAAALSA